MTLIVIRALLRLTGWQVPRRHLPSQVWRWAARRYDREVRS